MSGPAHAAAPSIGAGGAWPAPARPAAGLACNIAVAAAVLAAGAALVGAGVAWTPPGATVRADPEGARLYAAECAACHGARLEGGASRRQEAGGPPSAPPLGAAGHAWQHSDAELAATVAQGTGGAAPPGGMPAFAGRLSRSEIDAVLAYVRSRWPDSLRAYQAALNPGGEAALSALLRDPAWVFPTQCRPVPAAAGDR